MPKPADALPYTPNCQLRQQLQEARAAAEAAQARYAELYDFAPVALFTLDAGGAIAQLNKRAGCLLGAPTEQLMGRRFQLYVRPDSRPAFRQFLALVQGSRERHTAQLDLQTGAGMRFAAQLEGQPGPAGPAPTLQLAVLDVSPLSHETERRRRSEERLTLALAASGTGVWVWTFATNALEWDAQSQACFGRPHHSGPTTFAVLQAAVHPHDTLLLQRALQATIRHGHPLDLMLRAQWPNGSVHYLTANGKVQYNAQGRPDCLIGLVRDVTARHEAEAALEYRNRQLQQLLDNLPVMVARFAPSGELLEVAGAGLRRLGMPGNALVGTSLFDTFPSLTQPVRRLLAGEPGSFLGIADTANQRVYYQNYGFFDEQSQQGVLLAFDVTESEQIKKQLFEEQRFTKSLLDHYVDGVAAFDQYGRLTAWNRVMAALTGWAEAEALGQDVFACLPFGPASAPGLIVAHLLRGARRPRFYQPFSLLAPDRDFELTAIPLEPAHGASSCGGLLLLRNVTERNRLHASTARFKARQQRDTFRMVLVAQEVERKRIAEALHNGVGQLLYATRLHLEEGAKALGTSNKAMALLEEAIKALRSVSFELTPSVLEDFGLAVALQKLAGSIPPAKLRLHLYLAHLDHPLPQLLNVAIYRMAQELLNNVVKHAHATEATLHVAYEEGHVHISMEDDGGGFDVPSTVESAQGIGLAGLYNRAALLGGRFELVSHPGRGTIATVLLPVIEEQET
ncbi:PAS domain S-box protein [Hymenobacter glacialis]|uniref:histidine kinase n=1 Tax=Hymenobacter glacialis TaxID=1908236 RepID=A0A1G1T138_9BACT|nr:PAS domain S-box protein [Hymenobacter glacialis]OGX84595.1 hypothetical protein BEN48_02320 [Hymenobacter glacialis]